jgi:glycosyltransferase involved in cell wall biosynthesis
MPERLKIAFATPEYVTEEHFDGGLANYLGRVSRALSSLGHNVHVVTLSLRDEAVFDHDGVTVHRVMLKPGWQTIDRMTRGRLSTTLRWLNLSTQVYRKLRQLHRKVVFDLIQYPNYSFCGVLSIPLVGSSHLVRASSYGPALHEAVGYRPALDAKAVELLERLQFWLSGNVVTSSHTLQNVLTKQARLANVKVIRTPFYLEVHDWDTGLYEQFLKGRKYLLYFGRFQLHKGFHTLVQALPKFLEHHADARVVLVGRDMETVLAPSMADYARERCARFGHRVLFMSHLPHAQLYPIISGAHLVTLPSLVDNSPNACLESMGLGKAVVGTIGTSLDELIVDNVNGFLVRPGNSEELANKLIAAWAAPNLSEMGERARESMTEFSKEKTVESLLSYYRQLLSSSC